MQMEGLVNAYMHWSMGSDGLAPEYAVSEELGGEQAVQVLVVDVFRKFSLF